jgi:hypothetical protein
MKTKKYINRYNDEYTFTPTEDGHVLWEGKFEWCRSSWPNVYDDAHRRYQADGGTLSEAEFIEELHRQEYDAEGNWLRMSDICEKYHTYVYSDRDTIDMVDPSGGPFLSRGTDSEFIHPDVKGKKVDQFIRVETGYKIILK